MTIAHEQFKWKFGNRTVDFRVPVLQCGYERCAHQWRPRSLVKPKVCPKCKRRDWDVPHPKNRKAKIAGETP
jgi:hypothetical protein